MEVRKYKSNVYVTIFILILNHTQVSAMVTIKERESMFYDMLRDATGSLMTILGYVAEQSPRTVWPRRTGTATYNMAY